MQLRLGTQLNFSRRSALAAPGAGLPRQNAVLTGFGHTEAIRRRERGERESPMRALTKIVEGRRTRVRTGNNFTNA